MELLTKITSTVEMHERIIFPREKRDPMPGPVFLEGERVALRTVESEDLPVVRRTLSGPDVWRTLDRTRPVDGQASERWLERHSEDDDVLDLLVVDDDPVGLVSLRVRNEVWGLSSLHFWVAPDEQGAGYASAAAEAVVDYAFARRRQHKLIAHVFEGNEASCRLLEGPGFDREGVHRKEVYVDGSFRDLYTYGPLAEAW